MNNFQKHLKLISQYQALVTELEFKSVSKRSIGIYTKILEWVYDHHIELKEFNMQTLAGFDTNKGTILEVEESNEANTKLMCTVYNFATHQLKTYSLDSLKLIIDPPDLELVKIYRKHGILSRPAEIGDIVYGYFATEGVVLAVSRGSVVIKNVAKNTIRRLNSYCVLNKPKKHFKIEQVYKDVWASQGAYTESEWEEVTPETYYKPVETGKIRLISTLDVLLENEIIRKN